MRQLGRTPVTVHAALRFTDSSGREMAFDKDTVTVGSAPDCDLCVPSTTNVGAQHAAVTNRDRRVWCKALSGDPEDLLSDTFVWVNGNHCRPTVEYLLDSGDVLAFGEVAQTYTVQFEAKGGSSAALELMMKGMMMGASDEVKKSMEG